jgi:gliding motility-associated-like protein
MEKTLTLRPLMVLLLAGACTIAGAQTKYWTGGNGNWGDAARWSSTPGGRGGAGVPRAGEAVVIAPSQASAIRVADVAWCSDLTIDGSQGAVQITGNAEMNIAGSWTMQGAVQWPHDGDKRLVVRREGKELDLRGVPVNGDLVIDCSGSYSMLSDIHVAGNGRLVLKQGTLIGNANTIRAAGMVFPGRGPRSFMGGSGVVMLDQRPEQQQLDRFVNPGNTTLVVAGNVVPWNIPVPVAEGGSRDINICGTGTGQVVFVIDAQVTTNYNGFGVRCRGLCNATVTVTVSGGVGPFTYQWLNNGPNTQTWTTACGGPQIVIVTDLGQGISCAASVVVSEPGPLGIIFGTAIPPSCADECNGSRSAFAVGGVSPYTYNWNNGAGSGSSFNQLCPGANTLVVTDNNNCTRDTTFFFDVQPIIPNLTFVPTSCFGACNGSAQVAPTGGTGTITTVWSPGGSTGTSISGLCAGNWSVTLSDLNGCDTTLTFVIAEPPAIIPNLLTDDANCPGACDGTASVTVDGVLGDVTYLWSPAPASGQGTANPSGFCAGNYTLLVTDVTTGCDTLISFTIGEPLPIDAQAQVQDASCSTTCDGSITLQPVGGNGGFTFAWTPTPPGGGGAQITGLCPGPWQVTITDQIGCDTTLVFVVSAPPPVNAQMQVTDISCAGLCDGAVAVTVTGGVPQYDFIWNPAPASGQGTANASGFCAGSHTVQVMDANGCDTTIQFLIAEPPPLQATPTSTDVTCGSGCDGSASVLVAGGVPGYTYTWTPEPGAGQGSASASGLCAGNWSVLISDANGCSLTVPFVIQPATPILVTITPVDASCPGVCDGSASAVASGGAGGFLYAWSPEPGTGQGTAAAGGLCPQTYTLTVTDLLGCDTTLTVVIATPPPIVVAPVVTPITCFGSCDGSIQLNTTGGTGSYTWTWTPAPTLGQGTQNVLGLCAGNWEVLISSGACDTLITFVLPEPPLIEATVSITEPSCPGVCDGTADATVIGGTPPYTYSWSPEPGGGQDTPQATGLCAGVYELTVADATGCDVLLEITITDPLPITADVVVSPAGCNAACDGTAVVTATGGTPPYAYSWSPGVITGDGTDTATGLCPGSYTVEVTDLAGCVVTVPVEVVTPAPISVLASLQPALCANTCDGAISVSVSGGEAPFTYLWTPAPGVGQGTADVAGLCAGPYTLLLTDAFGCDTLLTYIITDPAPILPNTTVTDVTCAAPCNGSIQLAPSGGTPPYAYFWAPVPPAGQGVASSSGLCAGQWVITITDDAGCDTTLVHLIDEPQLVEAVLVSENVTCPGSCTGTATVNVSSGVPPFTFTWSPGNPIGQGTTSVSGLCAGSYSVLVADASGCDTTMVFTITQPPPLTNVFTVVQASCGANCDGSVTALVGGGTPPYSFDWGPGSPAGDGTATVSGLCPGAYSLDVTDDAGCTAQFTVLVDTPSGIVVSSSQTNALCSNTCDATIEVTSSGGVLPHTYTWTPEPGFGQGTPVVSGLCAGTYVLQITDNAGCDTLLSFTITAPGPILANGTSTNVNCLSPCSGSVQMIPTGGTPPYYFFWAPVPPAGQGQPGSGGLCAGDYVVTITDDVGCDTTVTFTILDQQVVQVDLAIVDTQCAGECNGSVTATVIGGVAPYTYLWSGAPAGQGTATASALCSGPGTLTVTDALGCATTVPFNVGAPPPFDVQLTISPEDCAGVCTGAASVVVGGGTGVITFLWTPEPGQGQGTAQVTGLCAGTIYSLLLTDELGCDSTVTFTVDPFTPITAGLSASPLLCAADCNSAVTATATGGAPPYTYTWTPAPQSGQGTSTATGFCAGLVEVLITDVNGCTGNASIQIADPEPLQDNAIVTDSPCGDVCAGSIVVSPSGGTGPYQVYWSPVPQEGQLSLVATNLCMGTYLVQVVDANGCEQTFSHEVFKPSPLEVTIGTTPSECLSCIGTATVSVSGGTPDYDLVWTDQQNTVLGTSEEVVDLCAGIYLVTVTDANGCLATGVAPVVDPNGEQLTVTPGITSCPGSCDGEVSVDLVCSDPPCTIAWSDGQGNDLGQSGNVLDQLCEGTYYVTVTNATGCVSISPVNVAEPAPLLADVVSTPESCPGTCDGSIALTLSGGQLPYVITWSPEPDGGQGTAVATGLCAGLYTVVIEDDAGCISRLDVLLPGAVPLQLDPVVNDATCHGSCDGSITPGVSGGTGSYSFDWSPAVPAGPDGTITGLCAGMYTLLVTDANGCTIAGSYTVEEPEQLQLTGASAASSCPACDGSASVSHAGGTAPFTYSWSYQGGVVGTSQSLTGLCGGLYSVTVTDFNGCTSQLSIIVPDNNAEVLTAVDGQVSCSGGCDGTVAVLYTCGTAPCTTIWTNAQGDVIAQDVDQVENLCVGTYTVQVTNAQQCTSVITVAVVPAEAITATLDIVPPSCATGCDGVATVVASGGVGGYTHQWSPETGVIGNTPVATGLCAGTYSVTITDLAGCDTTLVVVVPDPLPLVFTATLTALSCAGDCDAMIDVLVEGGTGALTHQWSPEPGSGQGTPNAGGLCAGEWTLTTTDANNCTHSETWTIDAPEPLILAGSSTESACGSCIGAVAVQVSGGTAGYAYSWTTGGTVVGVDAEVTDVCAGLYTVLVTDDAGCEASLVVPVSDVDGEEFTATGGTTSCPGACDGSASVNYTCADPACLVEWFSVMADPLAQGVDQLDGLCAGSYYVMITNGSGCITIEQVEVVDPLPIQLDVVTTPVSCWNDCDGAATVNASGGAGGFTYLWEPDVDGQGTATASSLCAGTYSVTVTDLNGCSVQATAVVTSPDELTAVAVLVPITCNGACDGSVTITASGGTGVLNISWSTGEQDVWSLQGLCATTVTATITDANGCQLEQVITLVDPPVLEVDLSTADNSCFGSCAGTADITITGGVDPYQITWNGSQGVLAEDVNAITGLCADAYTVVVIDASGCAVTLPFSITQGDAIQPLVQFTNETCNGPCDGTASVVATGGAGGFSYFWQPEPGAGQGTASITAACPDDYLLLITDAAGCDTTVAFTIAPFVPITATATVTDVQCGGSCDGSVALTASGGSGTLSYLWTPAPGTGQGTPVAGGLCAGEISVQISDPAGCNETYSFTLTEPDPLVLELDEVVAASCAEAFDGSIAITVGGGSPAYQIIWSGPDGFGSSDEDIADLAPGDYTVTIIDAAGCEITTTVTVDALTPVTADAGEDQQLCAGLPVFLSGAGSLGADEYVWTDEQGVLLGKEMDVVLTGLGTGTHIFTITVFGGDCYDADDVVVVILEAPVADAGPDQTIFVNNTVGLGGSPTGPPGSSFVWSPDSLLTGGTAANPIAQPLQSTWFTVTVTGPNGCQSLDSVYITVLPDIEIPSGFTPNGDGWNDTWILDFADLFPQIEVEVYSRWGERLFRSVGYKQPWDGRYNGGFVPVGTYYYVIDLHSPEFPEAFTGPLTVIR